MKGFQTSYTLVLWVTMLTGTWLNLSAQYVPVHLAHEEIYVFLDELASGHHIDLNSLVKPYSRHSIADLLKEADLSRSVLTTRQISELDFYLRDYMKEDQTDRPQATSWLWQKKHGNKRFDMFYYRDSLFQITVNPILGSDVWVNSNGSFYHWWNGVETHAYAGKFGFWASLRDNHESTELTARDFQNKRIGAAYIKTYEEGKRDYEEFRGGITYEWKWGHVGLIYDHFSWGENNAGANIFSGRTPAFARLELSLNPVKWFSFRYVHGFLHSESVDSTQSFYISNGYGTDYRQMYHNKFLAANMFSFTAIPGLELSIGNSVIYDYRYPNAAYLVPIAFFKAIDHAQTAGIDNMNSQIFLSASSRNLKNFHFHGTMFIDELAVDRITKDDEFNFLSFKGGFSSTIIPNTRIVAEYTWTNSLTFMHFVPTTTFESNQYNLGHYLEDNAKDIYVSVDYSLWRTLRIKAYVNHSLKGPDHTELGTNPRQPPPFDPIVWESTRIGLLVSAQIINDLYVRLGYEWRDVSGEQEYIERWTPGVYYGTTGTLRLGMNYGF